jgi:hypothetical protein
MNRVWRPMLVVVGALALLLAVGFFFQSPLATGLWPWSTSRLSNIFIASILAASGVPVIWLGLSGDLAAMFGGAANFAITYAGIGGYSAMVYARDPNRTGALVFTVLGALLALICVVLMVATRRLAFRDTRPTPVPVRLSFTVFMLLLLYVGARLVGVSPGVFPWALNAEQSVLFGWIFLGAAAYFAYGLWQPVWSNAKGQLLGFLAYDLVLIVPFLRHFERVQPHLWINLVIYLAVIIYSGLLAIAYLYMHRDAFERLKSAHQS